MKNIILLFIGVILLVCGTIGFGISIAEVLNSPDAFIPNSIWGSLGAMLIGAIIVTFGV